MLADSLPPPETIQKTAQEVLARPYYKLEVSPYEYDFSLLKPIVRFIGTILRPFQYAFAALRAISPVLAWIFIIVLCLLLAGLIAHIIYSFKVALAKRKHRGGLAAAQKEMADEPAEWEKKAGESAASGDYISALRYLFRACLLRLERAHKRPLRRGATNREYLGFFRKSSAYGPLSFFVEMIDYKWYGGDSCTLENYQEGKNAHLQILSLEGRTAHADGA